uniref:Ovule protein n=1 Tax=Strongyloides venezuelensis TaxID=75913 RepID=A0A0K0FLY6_STRVS
MIFIFKAVFHIRNFSLIIKYEADENIFNTMTNQLGNIQIFCTWYHLSNSGMGNHILFSPLSSKHQLHQREEGFQNRSPEGEPPKIMNTLQWV